MPRLSKMDGPDDRFVYLFECNGTYKIGVTHKIKTRLNTIAACCPMPVSLVSFVRYPQAARLEYFLHRKYEKVRGNGEWFALSADQVDEVKSLMQNPPSVDEVGREFARLRDYHHVIVRMPQSLFDDVKVLAEQAGISIHSQMLEAINVSLGAWISDRAAKSPPVAQEETDVKTDV